MKFDIQRITDSESSSRYTLYETWFNNKITIVSENKIGSDWVVNNSLSVPKLLFKILRPENLIGSIAPGLEGAEISKSNFRYEIIGDRFDLPDQVRKVFFQRDCEEIPLSENQLGYFSDLETLEWFWEIVSESQRTKEVSPPSPFQTPPAEDSTQEGEMLFEHAMEPQPTDVQNCEKSSDAEVFVCESHHTPKKYDRRQDVECPTAPKKKRVLRRLDHSKVETFPFSQF